MCKYKTWTNLCDKGLSIRIYIYKLYDNKSLQRLES